MKFLAIIALPLLFAYHIQTEHSPINVKHSNLNINLKSTVLKNGLLPLPNKKVILTPLPLPIGNAPLPILLKKNTKKGYSKELPF
ncbi:MAG: hypothetical protein Q8934_13125 [Bacillota bacterium]|nr:hypothetical protein [Bacillota bacterium]